MQAQSYDELSTMWTLNCWSSLTVTTAFIIQCDNKKKQKQTSCVSKQIVEQQLYEAFHF